MGKVLVIGASQGVGRETVKALLADGHEVRAFARSASKQALAGERLEKRDGDALSAGDVASALEGCSAVVQSLGVPLDRHTLISGTTLFSRATRVLVDAMQANGPRRLVAVTGIGAGDSRGHLGFLYDGLFFPLLLKRIYDDKDIEEQMIRASSLDWTLVRPGILTDATPSGRYRALTDRKDWRAAPIARADVARFIADEIRDGRFIRQAPVVIP